MSGPKAVRVVSREERIARCESVLAELDAQVSEWLRVGEKLGVLTEKDQSGAKEKISTLRELLRSGQFDQVDRQTPMATEFLRRDLEERIDRAAEKRRQEKTTRRRLGNVAAQTLEMINAGGQDLDPSIRSCLESAATGTISDEDAVERSINEAVVALSSPETAKSLSDEHKVLAESLKGVHKVQTVSDWVVANPQFDDDLSTKVDGYIAALEVSEDVAVAAPFAERAQEIRAVSNRGRRRMLLDTLIIDLASEVKGRRDRRDLFSKAVSLKTIFELDDEFSRHEYAAQISNLVTQWADADITKAKRILSKASQFVEREQRNRDAKHRRDAMLEAFSELGYEIREGLETAWVEDKRIVVRKSEQLDHGVELSGNAENGRLQVRAVRFAASGRQADKQRDIDIETVWCSEFGKLRDILDKKGSQLTIEKAKAVGETPVKLVETPQSGRREDKAIKPQTRRLPSK